MYMYRIEEQAAYNNYKIFVLCSRMKLHFLNMFLKLVAAVIHFTLIVLNVIDITEY